ncbi:MAG: DUF4179 domain-containing protein [Clostridiales bacterium]|nr:DUF4179 domain-containing protein [Clostridiales bacterium]
MGKFYEDLQNCSPESLPDISTDIVPASSHRRIKRLVKRGIKQDKTSTPLFATKPSFGKFALAAAMVVVISIGAVMLPFRNMLPSASIDSGDVIPAANDGLDMSVTKDGVTLTADRIYYDGKDVCLSVHISYPEVAGRYLMCEQISIRSDNDVIYKVDGPTQETALKSLFAADLIFYYSEERKNSSFELEFKLNSENIGTNDLVLTFENLFALDFEGSSMDDEYSTSTIIDEISLKIPNEKLMAALDHAEKFIADNTQSFDTSVTKDDVTLTALSITQIGKYTYLNLQLEYPEMKGEFLMCEELAIDTDGKNLIDQKYVSMDEARMAIYSADFLKYLEADERTTCELTYKLELPTNASTLTITIDKLYNAYYDGDNDITETYPITDSISLTVSLDAVTNK